MKMITTINLLVSGFMILSIYFILNYANDKFFQNTTAYKYIAMFLIFTCIVAMGFIFEYIVKKYHKSSDVKINCK